MTRLEEAQVHRRRLAIAARLGLERNLLTFIEVAKPCALYCRDVHEHVIAAVIRLNEAEAFLTIEPLDDALSHEKSYLLGVKRPSSGPAFVVQQRITVKAAG